MDFKILLLFFLVSSILCNKTSELKIDRNDIQNLSNRLNNFKNEDNGSFLNVFANNNEYGEDKFESELNNENGSNDQITYENLQTEMTEDIEGQHYEIEQGNVNEYFGSNKNQLPQDMFESNGLQNNRLQYGGSQHGGPQNDESQHDGLQDGKPQHSGPQHGGSHLGGPHHSGPPQEEPNRGHRGPQHGGPHHSGPQHGGPHHGRFNRGREGPHSRKSPHGKHSREKHSHSDQSNEGNSSDESSNRGSRHGRQQKERSSNRMSLHVMPQSQYGKGPQLSYDIMFPRNGMNMDRNWPRHSMNEMSYGNALQYGGNQNGFQQKQMSLRRQSFNNNEDSMENSGYYGRKQSQNNKKRINNNRENGYGNQIHYNGGWNQEGGFGKNDMGMRNGKQRCGNNDNGRGRKQCNGNKGNNMDDEENMNPMLGGMYQNNFESINPQPFGGGQYNLEWDQSEFGGGMNQQRKFNPMTKNQYNY